MHSGYCGVMLTPSSHKHMPIAIVPVGALVVRFADAAAPLYVPVKEAYAALPDVGTPVTVLR